MMQLLQVGAGARYRNPFEMIERFGLVDLLADPIYIMAILAITYLVRQKHYPEGIQGSYLMGGMLLKLLAGLTFAAVYVYYYEGRGDTFYYYDGAKAVRDAFYDSPVMGVRVLLAESGSFDEATFPYTSRIPTFWRGNDEVVFMCKITGAIMVFAFQSYWLATLLISALAFTGVWKLYRFFVELYPDLVVPAAVATLFIPSALFWGSGILKDTVCIGALGWLTHACYNVVAARKNLFSSLVVAALSAYFIFHLKAYILYAFVPAIGIWLFLRFQPRSEAIALKYALVPVFLALIAGSGALIIQGLGSSSDKYAIEDLEDRAKGFQSYHSRLAEQGQSGYSLGDVEFTPGGMAAKFPAAINVTYFRPYPWEIQDPFQALSALESMAFMILFLHTLFVVGPFRMLRIIGSNPEAAMCTMFSLVFGFAVGITAYNFGALVRFKVPGLPFFLMALFIIRWAAQQEKVSSPGTAPGGSRRPGLA